MALWILAVAAAFNDVQVVRRPQASPRTFVQRRPSAAVWLRRFPPAFASSGAASARHLVSEAVSPALSAGTAGGVFSSASMYCVLSTALLAGLPRGIRSSVTARGRSKVHMAVADVAAPEQTLVWNPEDFRSLSFSTDAAHNQEFSTTFSEKANVNFLQLYSTIQTLLS